MQHCLATAALVRRRRSLRMTWRKATTCSSSWTRWFALASSRSEVRRSSAARLASYGDSPQRAPPRACYRRSGQRGGGRPRKRARLATACVPGARGRGCGRIRTVPRGGERGAPRLAHSRFSAGHPFWLKPNCGALANRIVQPLRARLEAERGAAEAAVEQAASAAATAQRASAEAAARRLQVAWAGGRITQLEGVLKKAGLAVPHPDVPPPAPPRRAPPPAPACAR